MADIQARNHVDLQIQAADMLKDHFKKQGGNKS
jgi:hypothetical protein